MTTPITLQCDCGCCELIPFGPFSDSPDIGLRRIFTCSRCAEQLRLYQTSDEWRSRRESALAAVVRAHVAAVDEAARTFAHGPSVACLRQALRDFEEP